jgi:hypothetical protein
MNSTEEVPLIYTTRGNLPVKDLDYKVDWQFDEKGISFVEEYLYEGEIVKRGVARYQLPHGMEINLIQGAING